MPNYLDETGLSRYDGKIKTVIGGKLDSSLKGANNGLAELDSNGKVPSSQLPSYVDDIIEGYLYNGKFYKEAAHTTEITGETGKIYVDLSTEKTYRYSGSAYVEISESLALGETSSTAYAGDKGKANSDHIGNMSSLTTTEKGSLVGAINEVKSSIVHSGNYFGTCTGQAANQKKTVTIASAQNFVLEIGAVISIKFDANNTYSATAEAPVMLNVNSSGDITVYGGASGAVTGTNTTYFGRTDAINQYVYDGTYWVWTGSSYDNNTTYTPQALGFGYGTCTTAEATAAKTATLSGYALTTNGIVVIKFSNAVPASATLNINSKGAKAIYHKGAAITAGVINAGDIATFIYSSRYHLISVNHNFESLSAASSGTDLSLVTTGEKYTWNNKSDLVLGETASTAYAGDKGKANAEAIEAMVNEYGAKNLLPNNATNQTIQGVTFTINGDGSVTASGTEETGVYYVDLRLGSTTLQPGEYYFSGCPSGGDWLYGYSLWLHDNDSLSIIQTGTPQIFTITSPVVVTANLVIRPGVTVSNLTFYPMIRDARITDSTYVPYAMTNKELSNIINQMITPNMYNPIQHVVPAYASISYTDLNNFIGFGIGQGSGMTNAPDSSWSTVISLPFGGDNSDYCIQLCFQPHDMYIRFKEGGNWSTWTTLHHIA